MSPLVKVIVPCYRYGDLLEDCLASITSQEGVDVRVLVVDDCSPDDTAAIATRLAAADERIEFRRNEENKGLIGTANEGLEWAADSDYVVLLSADDFLTPGCLARAVGVMERKPGVGLVYGRPQFFEPGSEPGPPPPQPARWRGTTVWSGKRWIELRCRAAHNCIASPEAVVRTSVQRQVGGYDPACYHTSDLNMWLRIAAVADVAYVRGAVQAMYRIHADSMLRSDADPMVDLRERRNGFERFFAGAGSATPGRAGMERTVRRTLARQALWQASRAYDRGELDGPGAAPVAELVEFALETCPEAKHLREWAGLRLRRKIGAGRSLLFVPFLATGAGHRVRGHLGQLRWRLERHLTHESREGPHPLLGWMSDLMSTSPEAPVRSAGAPADPPLSFKRKVGRRVLRPALEAAAQRPRIVKYRLLSTCRRVSGTPVALQPILFVGPGEVALGEGVQFGWKNSPLFYAGYCHVEVSGADSRIEVGDRTEFNNNLMLKSEGEGIRIGKDCLFGAEVQIFDSDFHQLDPAHRVGGTPKTALVEIGDNVFAGMGVKILKGVTIGDDSVIGAGSVVTSSIPAGVIAAGNPARVIREL